MKERLKTFTDYFCVTLYTVSMVVAVALTIKVVDVRSKCTKEKKLISKLVSEIKELKERNRELNIEYYQRLRPETVDKNSQELHFLKENEVKYLR